eukprot:364305-Chlamydomonas_euryale.AAC.8
MPSGWSRLVTCQLVCRNAGATAAQVLPWCPCVGRQLSTSYTTAATAAAYQLQRQQLACCYGCSTSIATAAACQSQRLQHIDCYGCSLPVATAAAHRLQRLQLASCNGSSTSVVRS